MTCGKIYQNHLKRYLIPTYIIKSLSPESTCQKLGVDL